MSSSTTHAVGSLKFKRASAIVSALSLFVAAQMGTALPAYAQDEAADFETGTEVEPYAGENLNAELPEAGEYSCLKPGKHEFTILNRVGAPQVVLRDYTTPQTTDRVNYSVVIPVPDYLMRHVAPEDKKAGFDVIASEGAQAWTLQQANTLTHPWIGISTLGWDFSTTNGTGLHFGIDDFTGPGALKMWTMDAEKGIELRLNSADSDTAIAFDKPGVTHVNTTFTVPGFYEVDYTYAGSLKGLGSKQLQANFLVYYAVGNEMVAKACGEEFTKQPSTADSSTGQGAGSEDTSGHGAQPGAADQAAGNGSVNENEPAVDTDETGHGNASDSSNSSTETPDKKENGNTNDSTGNVDPGKEPGSDDKGQSADKDASGKLGKVEDREQSGNPPVTQPQKTDKKAATDANPAASLLSSTLGDKKASDRARRSRATSPTADTTPTGPETCEAVLITRESEAHEADKVRQAQGEEGTGRTTINVSVGDNARGNANDGHFDLGPIVDNGTIYARVKDDRTQPAQWLDPSDLTFGLGKAAAIQAPAALSFVAPAGKKVWMVQQSQQKNVPWIGMNSQHPSILSETTGDVTFTLESVEGPGKVAVFESGAFGSGVGEIVFNGSGSSYTIGANTHAHHNWVFTEAGEYRLTLKMKVEGKKGPIKGSSAIGGGFVVTGEIGPNGRPMIQEIVGRTPSGKECNLAEGGVASSGLASTGADAQTLIALSIGMMLLAGLMLSVRKNHA